MNLNNLEKVLIYLISSIPLALITGPFIPDLILVICCLIFIFLVLKTKNYFFLKSKFLFYFILFYFYILLRSIFSENVSNSLESSLFYFRFIIFIYAVHYCFSFIENSKSIFNLGLIVAFSILIFDSYFQYINGYNTLGFKYTPPRLSSYFGDELILGGYLSRFFPLLLGFLFLKFSNAKNLVIYVSLLLIIVFYLVILSGERSSLLTMLIISIAFIILCPVSLNKKLILIFLFICFVFLTIFLNESVFNRIINYTLVQVYIDGKLQMSPQHMPIFESAIKMFIDNPIFGVGPKNFRILCLKELYFVENGCATHPHNYYIQLLAETGIIGFSFIAFLYLILISKIIKNFFFVKSVNLYYCFLLLSLFISFWPFVPSSNLFNNWISIVNFLPIGIILSEQYVKKNI